MEGPAGLSDGEAERFLRFMKFANVQTIEGYRKALEQNGCDVQEASDTKRFAPYVDLYLQMVDMQLTGDALRILRFDATQVEAVAGEMAALQELAHAGKVAQGRFVARRR